MTGRPVVSILMPLFNCEAYVEEAINSIIHQTFPEWELIVVDDCSSDRSLIIAQSFQDDRIKVYRHESNGGAAAARNTALEYATGEFIAFMDSDDVWLDEKLEKQIAFMKTNHTGMCFTAYETIEANGAHRNYVKVPERIDYKGFLKNTVTCSHTIVFDCHMVNREWLKAPSGKDYDFPEDMATWLQVLKHGVVAYGLNEVLAKNRKHEESRSANKGKAVHRTWNQYRKGERLSLPYSIYCLFWQLTHAVLKRI